MSRPLVSCVMVTRDRVHLAKRAIRCLAAQRYRPLELLVIDDGDADYSPAFEDLDVPVNYIRLAPDPERKLGALRNLGLDHARGELIAQWDDDEWYHPDRIATQVHRLVTQDAIACVLKWTLMHCDTPDLEHLPYRADTGSGTPGTIVHRKTDVRYPNLRRNEDGKFLDALAARGKVVVLDSEASHLFIRCFHGSNTWELSHFQSRLRRTPLAALHWLWARVRGDLRLHPQLQLTPVERRTIDRYLGESRALGILGRST